jgi:hypothetical protein
MFSVGDIIKRPKHPDPKKEKDYIMYLMGILITIQTEPPVKICGSYTIPTG